MERYHRQHPVACDGTGLGEEVRTLDNQGLYGEKDGRGSLLDHLRQQHQRLRAGPAFGTQVVTGTSRPQPQACRRECAEDEGRQGMGRGDDKWTAGERLFQGS